MSADFDFGSGNGQTPSEPASPPPAADGIPPVPPQPETPPVPPAGPYQGSVYTPPTPVGPTPVNGMGSPYAPPYGSQPGYPYSTPPQGGQPQQPYTYYQQRQPGYVAPYYPPPAVQSAPGNGYAIASLILGIVAMLTSCSIFLALPCAVVGLVLGIVGKSKGAGGMAVAGIILSILGLALSVFLIIAVITSSSFDVWLGETMPYTMSSFMR